MTPTLESERLKGFSMDVMFWPCHINQMPNPNLKFNSEFIRKQILKGLREITNKESVININWIIRIQSNEAHLDTKGSHLLGAEDTWSHILHHLSQVKMLSKMVQ